MVAGVHPWRFLWDEYDDAKDVVIFGGSGSKSMMIKTIRAPTVNQDVDL